VPAMRIQICGRIAVERDGRRVEDGLPGPQGRLAFAYLIVNRHRPVTRDELAGALWDDAPPERSERGLSAVLSKLRRVLGPETLGGATPLHVRLPLGTWIDLEAADDAVHRAESAVAQRDWTRAWAASQVALNTARRGFLAGEDAAWVDACRRHLSELEVRSLETYAAAALGLGGAEQAAAERAGRDLVVAAPYRESGYRHLMTALAAGGNVAEALRVYDGLRRRLDDDLGIVPCATTRALHERLLRETAAPAAG
jgi:SARP family transcriptional regulator, regulator of embCAB operon